ADQTKDATGESKSVTKNEYYKWTQKTEECDKPQHRAQRKKPKFSACPQPLRSRRAREYGEKCLSKNGADRDQKNRKNKFHPTRRHRKRIGRSDEASRGRARDTSDNLPAALGFAPSAIVCRSSLRCSQNRPQITRIATNLEKRN